MRLFEIIQNFEDALELYYGVETSEDEQKALEVSARIS